MTTRKRKRPFAHNVPPLFHPKMIESGKKPGRWRIAKNRDILDAGHRRHTTRMPAETSACLSVAMNTRTFGSTSWLVG